MNRIAGLLASVGVLLNVDAKFRAQLDRLCKWNGQPLPEALRVRLFREWQKVELLSTQIHDLERARRVWRYLDAGVIPEGAILKGGQMTPSGR